MVMVLPDLKTLCAVMKTGVVVVCAVMEVVPPDVLMLKNLFLFV